MSRGGVICRPLSSGEELLWHAAGLKAQEPPDPEDLDFTSGPGFDPDAHIVALLDSAPAGRLETLFLPGDRAIMVDPISVSPISPLVVARCLLDCAVARLTARGILQPELIVQSRLPYADALNAELPHWGFRFLRKKLLYRRDRELELSEVPPLGEGYRLEPLTNARDPLLLDLVAAVNDDLTEQERSELLEEIAADSANSVYWSVLHGPDGPVGYVLPAPAKAQGGAGGVTHMGVRKEFRKGGLGSHLQGSALKAMSDAGAGSFLSSTGSDNVGMKRIFDRLGYTEFMQQFYFIRDGQPEDSEA